MAIQLINSSNRWQWTLLVILRDTFQYLDLVTYTNLSRSQRHDIATKLPLIGFISKLTSQLEIISRALAIPGILLSRVLINARN